MKRVLIGLIAFCLIFGYSDMQAQNKSGKGATSSKSSKKTTSKGGKKGKKGQPEKPEVVLTPLPYNCNDIIFAIPLQVDRAYGPTTTPQGAGRVMEVMADAKHPNLPEFEHNSVWYKFTVPYNGQLEIAVTQQDLADDYDMLVYRYTDVYFSNHVQCNKVLPVAINMSSPDTSLLVKKKKTPAAATGDDKADVKARAEAARKAKAEAEREAAKGTIGMNHAAEDILLTKESMKRHIRSIEVRKDEVYYIMLDKVNSGGAGHSIKVSIHVDAFEAPVFFTDQKTRKNVDVNLVILEKNTNNREIVKEEKFRGGRVKFVPGYNYTLHAKRDGYFSVFLEFNADRFKEDTMLRIPMNKAERGTEYPISDIYFADESKLLPESDSVLINYVQMFKNHPDISFMVKGFVQTYGTDPEHDQLVSLERAKSVKEFFVKNGISEDRIRTAGMTPTEIKRASTAAFDPKKNNEEIKVKIIIISVGSKTNP